MGEERRIWLINNEASGSNDAAALRECEDLCEERGLRIVQRTVFPQAELPTPAMLDAADIEIVALYAGDGTINAALRMLTDWQGQVLVLPGGTKNLLFHRLFADLTLEEAIASVADGSAVPLRPAVIQSPCGIAYAGLLAGPGTAWSEVREAMRDNSPLETVGESTAAFAETLYGDRLRCEEPAFGARDGYPLILLTPEGDAIAADAYHAEDAGEFLKQFLAVVRREFREGPHERIGEGDRFVLGNVEGGTFGLLLDGEPCDAEGPTEFTLARSAVDLLATRTDG